jgi:SAM-dependent methyltransferase
VDASGLAPGWLALREPADHAARATDLLDPLRRHLGPGPLAVHDLGCGTGSMCRWLAPRLPGPQRWTLVDRDPDLLDRVAATMTGADAPRDADGRPVDVHAAPGDLTDLRAADLAGTGLVTASALLDMLTAEEIDGLAAACADRPTLLAMTVAGEVEFDPADPLDAEFTPAFNDHQRRTVAGRTQAGPDATAAATASFRRHGATVLTRPTPWRLGPGRSALLAVWLRGWLAAAVEQRPDLARHADGYRDRRMAACAAGELRAVVHHHDLLALPPEVD